MTSPTADLTIADAVEDLRNQIIEARKRGKDAETVKFSLHEVEVELHLVVEQKDGLEGKAGFTLPFFGAEGRYGSEATTANTHKIRFKLDVEDANTGQHVNLGR